MTATASHTIESALHQRMMGPASWLQEKERAPVVLHLPADIHQELQERAEHDNQPLEARLEWLIVELVKRGRAM